MAIRETATAYAAVSDQLSRLPEYQKKITQQIDVCT
jgi:hypothetical protein